MKKYLFVVLVLAFVCLSYFITVTPIPSSDLAISLFIQQVHSNFLDRFMLGISLLGELPYSILLVVVFAGIFFKFKFKREGLYTLFILYSGLIILGVKNLVNRPRPTEFYVRLVEINRFKSFPSGHVMSYVLFFGFMIFLMRHLKNLNPYLKKATITISVFFIIMIPISRVYLGAHWFTDTLGGAILGIICLQVLCHFYLKRKKFKTVIK